MSLRKLLISMSIGLSLAAPAQAGVIELFDWGFNIDGTAQCSLDPLDGCAVDLASPLLPGIDASGFDFNTGLGSVDIAVTGAGSHYVSFFVDHQIDDALNTYFNETGDAAGTLEAGQSYEVDEPGFVFGDIIFNFVDSTLDNSVAADFENGFTDDVSLALAWTFDLLAGQTANISFLTSRDTVLGGMDGFRLSHFDPDSNDELVFSSALTILDNPITPVPAPGALSLMLIGLAGFGLRRRTTAAT